MTKIPIKRFMRFKVDQNGQAWIKKWNGQVYLSSEQNARWRKCKTMDKGLKLNIVYFDECGDFK